MWGRWEMVTPVTDENFVIDWKVLKEGEFGAGTRVWDPPLCGC